MKRELSCRYHPRNPDDVTVSVKMDKESWIYLRDCLALVKQNSKLHVYGYDFCMGVIKDILNEAEKGYN